jgi:uncharacterized protein YjbI with pentapeptide repeats
MAGIPCESGFAGVCPAAGLRDEPVLRGSALRRASLVNPVLQGSALRRAVLVNPVLQGSALRQASPVNPAMQGSGGLPR